MCDQAANCLFIVFSNKTFPKLSRPVAAEQSDQKVATGNTWGLGSCDSLLICHVTSHGTVPVAIAPYHMFPYPYLLQQILGTTEFVLFGKASQEEQIRRCEMCAAEDTGTGA